MYPQYYIFEIQILLFSKNEASNTNEGCINNNYTISNMNILYSSILSQTDTLSSLNLIS